MEFRTTWRWSALVRFHLMSEVDIASTVAFLEGSRRKWLLANGEQGQSLVPRTLLRSRKVDWQDEFFLKLALHYASVNDVVGARFLLDVSLLGAAEGKIKESVSFMVIEAVFETLPLGDMNEFCEAVFARKNDLATELVGSKPPGTTLLRATNILVSRLAPVGHAVLISRLNLFLATTFGPGERTALNTGGQVLDEAFVYAEDEPDMPDYQNFWALQLLLSNLPSLLDVETLTKLLELAQSVFHQVQDLTPFEVESSQIWNPSQLTFRSVVGSRQTVVILAAELLIAFDFLLRRSDDSSAVSDDVVATIKVLQTTWRDFLGQLLSVEDLRRVKVLLASERSWVRWKADGSVALSRQALLADLEENIEAKAVELLQVPAEFLPRFGTQQLAELSDVPINLEIFKAEANRQPNAREIYDLGEGIDERDVSETYTWLTYRAASAGEKWDDLSNVTRRSGIGGLFGIEPKSPPLSPELGYSSPADSRESLEGSPRESTVNGDNRETFSREPTKGYEEASNDEGASDLPVRPSQSPVRTDDVDRMEVDE